MELIKSELQKVRRTVNFEAVETTATATIKAIAAIDVDLNRLKKLFTTASFILAEHDVKVLAQLCHMQEKIKLEVLNHLQKLKSIALSVKRPINPRKPKDIRLFEAEIFDLQIRLKNFSTKLFKAPSVNRRML